MGYEEDYPVLLAHPFKSLPTLNVLAYSNLPEYHSGKVRISPSSFSRRGEIWKGISRADFYFKSCGKEDSIIWYRWCYDVIFGTLNFDLTVLNLVCVTIGMIVLVRLGLNSVGMKYNIGLA